jgi:hypothetical protein
MATGSGARNLLFRLLGDNVELSVKPCIIVNWQAAGLARRHSRTPTTRNSSLRWLYCTRFEARPTGAQGAVTRSDPGLRRPRVRDMSCCKRPLLPDVAYRCAAGPCEVWEAAPYGGHCHGGRCPGGHCHGGSCCGEGTVVWRAPEPQRWRSGTGAVSSPRPRPKAALLGPEGTSVPCRTARQPQQRQSLVPPCAATAAPTRPMLCPWPSFARTPAVLPRAPAVLSRTPLLPLPSPPATLTLCYSPAPLLCLPPLLAGLGSCAGWQANSWTCRPRPASRCGWHAGEGLREG